MDEKSYVGRRVMVKPKNRLLREFRAYDSGDLITNPIFVDSMFEYCGKHAIITEARVRETYTAVNLDIDDGTWNYPIECLEFLDEEDFGEFSPDTDSLMGFLVGGM